MGSVGGGRRIHLLQNKTRLSTSACMYVQELRKTEKQNERGLLTQTWLFFTKLQTKK